MINAFWLSIVVLIYTWIGYYLCLSLSRRWLKKQARKEEWFSDVTVIITAFNEENTISNRIKNLLEQNYDKQHIEILVASDGSTDNTEGIVIDYAKRDERIRLMSAENLGKSVTQNLAILNAKGQVVVLTDADTLFEPVALAKMVRHFSNPTVGCVSGKLVLKQKGGSVAESQSLYWRFEMALRRIESEMGLLHTATGGIMAFRKDLFRPFNPKYGDDCIIPLDIAEQGYRVVHDDEAIAYDSFPSSMSGELRARTRMTLRNISCTLSKCGLLNPFKHPGLCWAIVSHKLLRWLTPFILLAAFISNVFVLAEGGFYLVSGLGQLIFYFLGLVGLGGELLNIRIPIASQIFSFLLANAGFFLGVLKALSGKSITVYRNTGSCHGA